MGGCMVDKQESMRLLASELEAAMNWHEVQCKAQGAYTPGVLPKRCADLVQAWYQALSETVTYAMLSPQAKESFDIFLEKK